MLRVCVCLRVSAHIRPRGKGCGFRPKYFRFDYCVCVCLLALYAIICGIARSDVCPHLVYGTNKTLVCCICARSVYTIQYKVQRTQTPRFVCLYTHPQNMHATEPQIMITQLPYIVHNMHIHTAHISVLTQYI